VKPIPGGTFHDLIHHGPLVEVTIQPQRDVWRQYEHIGLGVPTHRCEMLIDTGARHTVVDREIVESLGLRPVATITMFGVGGVVHDCPCYRVLLEVDVPHENGRRSTITVKTSIVGMMGCFPQGLRHLGLLGRSSLQNALLQYDGPQGWYHLSSWRQQ
jgi:hypothetical protein